MRCKGQIFAQMGSSMKFRTEFQQCPVIPSGCTTLDKERGLRLKNALPRNHFISVFSLGLSKVEEEESGYSFRQTDSAPRSISPLRTVDGQYCERLSAARRFNGERNRKKRIALPPSVDFAVDRALIGIAHQVKRIDGRARAHPRETIFVMSRKKTILKISNVAFLCCLREMP